MKDSIISFRCPSDMAEELTRLGGDNERSRSNVVYLLVSAALSGAAPDMLRILR